MPNNNILASVFGRSPIGPIQKHISTVHECALQLEPFFLAVFASDWDEAEVLQQKITKLENKADAIKRRIRLSLPKSLFLPVPRTDLLEIVTVQDKVANRAKDIAGLMIGRKMMVPESMHDAFIAYVRLSIKTSAQALTAIHELDSLLETGFQGREVDLVERMVEELNSIENETDQDQVKVRRLLFDIEQTLPPIDVIFLYKIIDWVGDLADRASRVGSHLQLLLAR
ncbi:TIGR00153 family protein [uncultured Endozoicomonas sp.]|uniref:TIGR00153 family protein n=1 Tax=uncultured Endozoicomonas sp. TaxID=432652 RepID=UPI00262A540A|nr:TIGR00153 family protein [uncultured Endozoicomonas sp.]